MTRHVVVGEGAWGTAWAQTLACTGIIPLVWCHDSQVAHELSSEGRNTRYLPGHTVSRVTTTSSWEWVPQASHVYITTPISYLSALLPHLAALPAHATLWCMQKGLDPATGLLPCELVTRALSAPSPRVGCMYGPAFAHDLVAGGTVVLTAAHAHESAQAQLRTFLPSSVHLEHTTDVLGATWCALLKNIISVGMGMIEGMNVNESTRALYLHRCMKEIHTLLPTVGGVSSTMLLSCGYADTILSSTFSQGRNRAAGKALGSGNALPELTCEGIASAQGWLTRVRFFPHLASRAPLITTTCTAIVQRTPHLLTIV